MRRRPHTTGDLPSEAIGQLDNGSALGAIYRLAARNQVVQKALSSRAGGARSTQGAASVAAIS